MGAGNYTNRFIQAGRLFMVTPSYPDEEAFEAHLKSSAGGDHDEPADTIEQFREDVREQEWSALQGIVVRALVGKVEGMEAVSGSFPSATFDHDFLLLARSPLVEVGIHEYEGDFLVAAAPAGELLALTLNPEGYMGEIASRFGMAGVAFSDASTELSETVGDYLRSIVQSAGLKPRHRVDAWTSSEYAERSPQELQDEQTLLIDRIEEGHVKLREGISIDAVHGEGGLRRSLIELADRDPRSCDFSVVTFAYDTKLGRLVAFDAISGWQEHRSFPKSAEFETYLARTFEGVGEAGEKELHELKGDEPVLDYLKAVAEEQVGATGYWMIPVLEKEFVEIFDRPLDVTYEGYSFVLSEETNAPAP